MTAVATTAVGHSSDELHQRKLMYPLAGLVSRLVEDGICPALAGCVSTDRYTQEEKALICYALSEHLLDPQHTLRIARAARPILLHLLALLTVEKPPSDAAAHEKLLVALSKLLPICPAAKTLAITYIKKSPSIFDGLLSRHASGAVPADAAVPLVRAALALLLFFKDAQGAQALSWNWDFVYASVEHSDETLRWLSIQCAGLVSRLSNGSRDAIAADRSLGPQSAKHMELLRSVVEEEVLEETLLLLSTSEQPAEKPELCFTAADLHPSIVEVYSVLLHKRTVQAGKNEVEKSQLVHTATTEGNLRRLALAICVGNPILLEGVTGSGKTTLIDEMADVTGNHDIIKIHLGDQSDAKVLLGSYVCTEVPGEFKWQPGALTQAVQLGRWIVIEDINLASMDVISVLMPLLESRKLFIPGRGVEIQAAHGFQIFATETLVGTGKAKTSTRTSHTGQLLNKFWTKVSVDTLSMQELQMVIEMRFPVLKPIAQPVLATFGALQGQEPEAVPEATESEVGVVAQEKTRRQSAAQVFASSGRLVSTRDLMKWCRRLEAFTTSRNIAVPETAQLPAELKDLIFCEAVACFCGMLATDKQRSVIMDVIAGQWSLSGDRVKYFLEMQRPSVQEQAGNVSFGRGLLAKKQSSQAGGKKKIAKFAHTIHSVRLLEEISVSVSLQEPVLLVGETGTGKTSVVQYMASLLGQTLMVQNLSQQSDSTDLLGGFKPVELQLLCMPLKNEFMKLFGKTWSSAANRDYMDRVAAEFAHKNWSALLQLMARSYDKVQALWDAQGEGATVVKEGEGQESGPVGPARGGRVMPPNMRARWKKLGSAVNKLKLQMEQGLAGSDGQGGSGFAFAFIEGALVKAVRRGHWVLLDEINLASTDTLESLSGLLEGGGLYLTERGDVTAVERHRNFRIFACMNPPTDVGKKELPPGLRNRFTEFYVRGISAKADLAMVVQEYLRGLTGRPPVEDVVEFFFAVQKEASATLTDGANGKPHYSLRTLCRGLRFTAAVVGQFGFPRALYEGMCMAFLSQLDRPSMAIMLGLIQKHFAKNMPKKLLSKTPARPGDNYVLFDNFWVETGDELIPANADYIITPSIAKHLHNLARIVLTRQSPVLLQGPTSSGKTSMVRFLASSTGHKFVRINNHEHTDIQEYLGSYVSDQEGNLVFQEGILVEAVRKGYWVVLDELNLAPSEVLEALNRLLDDNRELFIPETQEVIKPHPQFMLFATQNPPGLYGGRKALSRAFRNRFLELHFDDIPDSELETILQRKCSIPPTYCAKLVLVLKDLQRQRQGTQVFAGKHGFITLRDLFRWAERKAEGYEALAVDGFMLLAERLRNHAEKAVIQRVIEKHMRVKLDMEAIYERMADDLGIPDLTGAGEAFNIVWTKSMRRLWVIVNRCLEFQEPFLLVGETGCGKTTICQLLSLRLGRSLRIINCHQHTETADFLGSLRPIRDRDTLTAKLLALLSEYFAGVEGETIPAVTSETLLPAVKKFAQMAKSGVKGRDGIVAEITTLLQRHRALFEWQDGPLVLSMKAGELFLIDEISLAEDSVLERLNSVLEPDRTLVLAEKGTNQVDELVGHNDFRIMATMNPGGDFGKRELSPALRNRFTEIWVPTIANGEELLLIIEHRLSPQLRCYAPYLLSFLEWYKTLPGLGLQRHRVVSLRDILSWIGFMNSVAENSPELDRNEVYIHGACLSFLDGLGMTSGVSERKAAELFATCMEKLRVQAQELVPGWHSPSMGLQSAVVATSETFGVHPFFVSIGDQGAAKSVKYCMEGPTTSKNLLRILRALQIRKPLLLEGSPGVGKTSIVEALAASSGHRVVRINLSEQTDMMDLLGSDMPVEGGKAGQFAWSDGVLLQAVKRGDWVLLDELNLASQSVLEGLNSLLDHRSTVYIPEIGLSFDCPSSFRIFGCQNPTAQGGGRKGLPQSFLNRFTKVFVEPFKREDLIFITSAMHPTFPAALVERMVNFNCRMYTDSMVAGKFGRVGSPWEFNLRDVFRWCELLQKCSPSPEWTNEAHGEDSRTLEDYVTLAGRFVEVLYVQRMRTEKDRLYVAQLFEEVMLQPLKQQKVQGEKEAWDGPYCLVTPHSIQAGTAVLPRKSLVETRTADRILLRSTLPGLESLMRCVEMNWMAIILGAPASGKVLTARQTCLVQYLAQTVGKKLQQFSMNSSVDTTELLGGFEQVDVTRTEREVLYLLKRATTVATELMLSLKQPVKDLHAQWNLLSTKVAGLLEGDASAPAKPGSSGSTAELGDEEVLLVMRLLAALDSVALQAATHPTLAEQKAETERLTREARALLKKMEAMDRTEVSGCFEWIDGTLIRAMEQGDWLLIDNANFCNPTVLDRLNPLLEPNGKLLVNERGLVDGQVRVVEAHPEFRLFLTMDAANGEISRAMRNRGIEINLLPMDLVHSADAQMDARALLAKTCRIQGSAVPSAMLTAHAAMCSKRTTSLVGQPTIRHLLQWGSLWVEMLKRGESAASALWESFSQVYTATGALPVAGASKAREEARQVLASLFVEETSVFASAACSADLEQVKELPLYWQAADAASARLSKMGSFMIDAIQAVVSADVFAGVVNVLRQLLEKSTSGEMQPAERLRVREFLEGCGVSPTLWPTAAQHLYYCDPRVLPVSAWIDTLSGSNSDELLLLSPTLSLAPKDVLSVIAMGCQWFCENVAAASGLGVAATWLQAWFPSASSSQQFAAFVQYLSQHPLHQRTVASLSELLAGQGCNQQLIGQHVPLEWRSNGTLGDVLEDKPSSKAQLPAHCATLSALHLLMDRMRRDMEERAALTQKAKAGELMAQPTLLVTARSKRPAADESIPLVAAIDAALQQFDQFLDSAVFRAERPGAGLDMQALFWCTRLRDMVWDALNVHALDKGRFLVTWGEWKASLAALPTEWAAAVTLGPIESLMSDMEMHAGRLALWFRCHPPAVRQQALQDLHVAITMAVSEMDEMLLRALASTTQGGFLRLEGANGLATADTFAGVQQKLVSLRRMAAEGLSTLRLLDMQAVDTSAASDGAALLSSLVELPSLLAAEATKLSERIAFEASKVEADEGKAQKKALCRSVAGLAPLQDFTTVVMEMDLLARMAAAFLRPEEEQLQTLSLPLHRLVESTGETTLRSPLDVEPYQLLLWAIDSRNGGANVLRDVIQGAEVRFRSALWRNSFQDSISFLRKRGHRVAAPPSTMAQVHPLLVSEAADKLGGSSALFQAVIGTLAFHQNVSTSAISLEDRNAKFEQLKKLTSLLDDVELRTPVATDWSQLMMSFATVGCFLVESEADIKAVLDVSRLLEAHFHAAAVKEDPPPADERKHALTELDAVRGVLHHAVEGVLPPNDPARSGFVSLFTLLHEAVASCCSFQDPLLRGRLWLALGNVEYLLVMPASDIDPSSGFLYKINLYERIRAGVAHYLHMRAIYERNTCLPDRVTETLAYGWAAEEALAKLAAVKDKVVHRPDENSFPQLFSVVQRFNATMLGAKLQEVAQALLQRTTRAVDLEAMWQARSADFQSRMEKRYAAYSDALVPTLLAVHHIKHGLRTLLLQAVRINNPSLASLENLVTCLTEVPSSKPDVATQVTSHIITAIRSLAQSTHSSAVVQASVLKAALMRTRSRAAVHGWADPMSVKELSWIFQVYLDTWQKQRAEQKKRKEEEDSLYKYKERTHDIETEEEQEEREYRELFPDFSTGLKDLEEVDKDLANDENPAVTAEAPPTEAFRTVLNDDETRFLVQAHQDIYLDDGVRESVDAAVQREREEHILCYEAAEAIYSRCMKHVGSSDMDQTAVSGHVLAASVYHSHLDRQPSGEGSGPKRRRPARSAEGSLAMHEVVAEVYDVYRHANLPEAQLLLAPLARYMERLEGLLQQWSEHPVLLHLQKVAQRLMAFPLSSSLMQFVTGLELLLRHTHEWESFASSLVSLKEETGALALLVARWRRIELQAWPSLLLGRQVLFERKADRWWFFLFESVVQPILSALSNHACDGECAEGINSLQPLEKVTEILADFIQSSTVGEFRVRMRMLRAFTNQLVSVRHTAETDAGKSGCRVLAHVDRLCHVMENLHRYYCQYWAPCSGLVEECKVEISSEIRDYAKLAKWEKLEYYMLKSVAERSHRKLNRYARNFEKVLSQPVAQFFTAGAVGNVSVSASSIVDLDQRALVQEWQLHGQAVATPPTTKKVTAVAGLPSLLPASAPAVFRSGEGVSKAPRYMELDRLQSRSEKLIARDITVTDEHCAWVAYVDEVASTIIRRSADLKSEEVPPARKKLALTELLRSMHAMGVSYHKSERTEHSTVEQLLLQPPPHLRTASLLNFALSESQAAAVTVDGVAVTSCLDVWKRADRYFYRCISDVQQLRDIASHPASPDLSRKEVVVLTGSTEHLFRLLVDSQLSFGEVFESLTDLNAFTQFCCRVDNPFAQVEGDASAVLLLPNQAHCAVQLEKQEELLGRLRCANPQLLALAKCSSVDEQHARSLVSASSDALRKLNTLLPVALAQDSPLHFFRKDVALTGQEAETVQENFAGLQAALSNTLQGLCSSAVGEAARRLLTAIKAEVDVLVSDAKAPRAAGALGEEEGSSSEAAVAAQQFCAALEAVTEHILIALQRARSVMLKEFSKQSSKEGEEEEEEAEYKIVAVQAALTHLYQDLEVGVLLSKVRSMMQALGEVSVLQGEVPGGCVAVACCQAYVSQISALLVPFTRVVRQAIAMRIVWQKCLGKLVHVMAKLTGTLMIQGFCKAVEEGEMQERTEDDVAGTGMGEGDGKKDVSNEIEDEEQLHKPENDEKEKDSKEEEDGLETQQDFQAEAGDVEQKEEKDDDDSDSDSDSDEEEMDKEMGDVDRDMEDVVDEKLWDEEDEEEDNGQQDEGEGADVNADNVMDELMANEKEEGKDDEGGADEKEGKEEQGKEDAEEELDGSDGDDSDGSDGEGEEDPDGEMVDVEDDEDRNVMDSLQEEQEFELPEDMNLDGDEDGSEGEGQDEDIEMEDDGKEEEEVDEEEGDDGDEQMREADEDLGGEEEEGDEEEEEEKEGEKDEDELGKPQEPEEGEEAEQKEETMKTMDAVHNPYDDETKEQQIGVRDDTGNAPNVQEEENAPLDGREEETADNLDSEAAPSKMDVDGDVSGARENEDQPQGEREEDESAASTQMDTNPFRSLGDAAKEWKRRVQIIKDASEEETEQPASKEEQESADYEFSRNEEEAQQALGPATEEQREAAEMGEMKEGEEEEEKAGDNMDEDEKDSATDILLQGDKKQPEEDTEMEDVASVSSGQKQQEEEDANKGEEEAEEEKQQDEEMVGDQETLGRHRQLKYEVDDEEEEVRKKREEVEDLPEMDPEQEQMLREALEEKYLEWQSSASTAEAEDVWSTFEELVTPQAQELCEQLRLILEPTQATRLQGDYRTGKRLNMKKIIPFIASQFRKDKIWLRRTKPNKRQYQVLLAIDDSESMAHNRSGQMACEALAMIAKALAQLEVGDIGIVKFGEEVELLHPFDRPFTSHAGPMVLNMFSFAQKSTNMHKLMQGMVSVLSKARETAGSATESVQLAFVISDGRMSDQKGLSHWVREALKKRMLVVFIVLDSPDSKDSILSLETISFSGSSFTRKLYIDDFPFPYYMLLRNLDQLPEVIADALRQWFQLSNA